MIPSKRIFGYPSKIQNLTRMLNTLTSLETDIFTTQPTTVLFTLISSTNMIRKSTSSMNLKMLWELRLHISQMLTAFIAKIIPSQAPSLQFKDSINCLSQLIFTLITDRKLGRPTRWIWIWWKSKLMRQIQPSILDFNLLLSIQKLFWEVQSKSKQIKRRNGQNKELKLQSTRWAICWAVLPTCMETD